MLDVVTTCLDLLGLLLVAAGLAALTFPFLGWGCLLVAGVAVLAGSQVAAGVVESTVARVRARRARA